MSSATNLRYVTETGFVYLLTETELSLYEHFLEQLY